MTASSISIRAWKSWRRWRNDAALRLASCRLCGRFTTESTEDTERHGDDEHDLCTAEMRVALRCCSFFTSCPGLTHGCPVRGIRWCLSSDRPLSVVMPALGAGIHAFLFVFP